MAEFEPGREALEALREAFRDNIKLIASSTLARTTASEPIAEVMSHFRTSLHLVFQLYDLQVAEVEKHQELAGAPRVS
jgi:hypothetical protein